MRGTQRGLGIGEKLPLRAFQVSLSREEDLGFPAPFYSMQGHLPLSWLACPSLSLEGEEGNGLWSLFSLLLVGLLCFSLLSLGREAPGAPGRRLLSAEASPALSSGLPCLSLPS